MAGRPPGQRVSRETLLKVMLFWLVIYIVGFFLIAAVYGGGVLGTVVLSPPAIAFAFVRPMSIVAFLAGYSYALYRRGPRPDGAEGAEEA